MILNPKLIPEEEVLHYCSLNDLKNLSATCSEYRAALKARLFRKACVNAQQLSSCNGFFEKRRRSKQISNVLRNTESLRIITHCTTEHTCKIAPNAYKALSKLVNLSELHIHGEMLYIEHAHFSLLCEGLKSLRKLYIRQSRGVTDIAISSIERFKHLKELCLSGSQVTTVGLTFVSRVSTLTTLDISETPVNNHGVFLITKLCNLQVLILHGCWNLTNSCVPYFNHLHLLKHLVVSSCNITDITAITSLQWLTRICCNDTCVNDSCLIHLSSILLTVRDLFLMVVSGRITIEDIIHFKKLCPNVSIY